MEFQCSVHGKVDKFYVDGYGIAHETQVKAHERDFEGITFVVHPPDSDNITAENVEAESARSSYLEKFAGWDEDIASVIQNFYETGRGVEELECPHDNHGLQMDVTLVVDKAFHLDTSETVQGNFRVYQNTLYINEIVEYGSLSESELFDMIISEAEKLDVEDIQVSMLRQVDEFEQVLRDAGFTVNIKENSRGSERLEGEYDLY